MAAYVIAEVEITDQETYAKYREAANPTFKEFGGEFLATNMRSRTETLEGEPPKRIAIVKFDSMDAARRWYNSPGYTKAKEFRHRAAKSRLILVEGSHP